MCFLSVTALAPEVLVCMCCLSVLPLAFNCHISHIICVSVSGSCEIRTLSGIPLILLIPLIGYSHYFWYIILLISLMLLILKMFFLMTFIHLEPFDNIDIAWNHLITFETLDTYWHLLILLAPLDISWYPLGIHTKFWLILQH